MITILLVLFALPLPLSLISWIGTIMALPVLAEIRGFIVTLSKGAADWPGFIQFVHSIIFLITILLAGTYGITYYISAHATIKNNMIKPVSFLPLLHIVAFIVFYYISSCFENMAYK